MEIESINAARDLMRDVYENDPRPWVVAYSGGKDSTLLLQLALEVKQSSNVSKGLTVVFSDTLYEKEDKIDRINGAFKRLESIGVSTAITKPEPSQTILVGVIGQGWAPPDFRFRWCTRQTKLTPMHNLERRIASGGVGCVVLAGARKEESTNRMRRLTKLGAPRLMQTELKRENIHNFYPIADVSTLDVWAYLNALGTFVWGETIDELKTQYPSEAKTQRDGCWLCTVCSERSALKKFFCDEKNAIRVLLRAYKNDPKKRFWIQKEQNKRCLERGMPSGLFTLDARKELLAFIQDAEKKIGERIISDEELECIYDKWERLAPIQEQKYLECIGKEGLGTGLDLWR